MVWLWERGHDRIWILGLTLEQIADLYCICERLEARTQIKTSWMIMTAAQGKVKDMKGFLKEAVKLLKRSRRTLEAQDDQAEFKKRFGKGF